MEIEKVISAARECICGELGVDISRERLADFARYSANNLSGTLLARSLAVVQSIADLLQYVEEGE